MYEETLVNVWIWWSWIWTQSSLRSSLISWRIAPSATSMHLIAVTLLVVARRGGEIRLSYDTVATGGSAVAGPSAATESLAAIGPLAAIALWSRRFCLFAAPSSFCSTWRVVAAEFLQWTRGAYFGSHFSLLLRKWLGIGHLKCMYECLNVFGNKSLIADSARIIWREGDVKRAWERVVVQGKHHGAVNACLEWGAAESQMGIVMLKMQSCGGCAFLGWSLSGRFLVAAVRLLSLWRVLVWRPLKKWSIVWWLSGIVRSLVAPDETYCLDSSCSFVLLKCLKWVPATCFVWVEADFIDMSLLWAKVKDWDWITMAANTCLIFEVR